MERSSYYLGLLLDHGNFNILYLEIIMDYPRVTEVLKPFSNIEHIPEKILKNAATRGTSVHALCASIAKGAWVPDTLIEEEYKGYVESFKLWANAQVKKFHVIEKRYTEESYKYTGQVDYVVIGTDNEYYLIDIKTTSRPQKTHPIQMAAYTRLLQNEGIYVRGTMLIYLDKTGQFPDIRFYEDLTKELDIFLSALNCWHFFNRKGDKEYDRAECEKRADTRDSGTKACS